MIRIQREPIEVDAVIREVSHPGAGAVDVFIGTTRNEAGGRGVRSLEYEAHGSMAEKEIGRIVETARTTWRLSAVSVVHRVGLVPVGEASVVIAVSAPHRAEAFEACRFVIDSLKQTVPIWKKEKFDDGSTAWSEGASTDRKT
jgi:molybdopterin synthase catalytic subunit